MLTIEDLSNFGFDIQRPTFRQTKNRNGRGYESIIEGVTRTNNFNMIGFTYYTSDGLLVINGLSDSKNIQLYKGIVLDYQTFNQKLKYVDRKIRTKNIKLKNELYKTK